MLSTGSMTAQGGLVRSGLSARSIGAYQWLVLHRHGMSSPLTSSNRPLISSSMVISLFWLGWTVWDNVSPVLPAFGGFFFGIGFQLLFMGMSNYITDVFRDLSASAQAAASATRSIAAILLPLAAGSMYSELGIHWAPSLLGFVALAMGVIPFVFIRYGETLARKSKSARAVYGVE